MRTRRSEGAVMTIIMVSRGSYSRGEEVARKVAQAISFQCVSREILLDASTEFNIPEIKLLQLFDEVPSILNRLSFRRTRFITHMQSSLLTNLVRDNIVYHGFAEHLFVKDISHVLKVRVVADLEDRVKIVMDRDKIPREEVLLFLEKLDAQRRRWSKKLYGIDPQDPSQYDLVLNIRKIGMKDAVATIVRIARLRQLQTTPESKMALEDLAMAAEARRVLADVKGILDVCAENGFIYVEVGNPLGRHALLARRTAEIANKIPGVKGVNVVSENVCQAGYLSKQSRRSTGETTATFFSEL
jgi:cytidylate kinase